LHDLRASFKEGDPSSKFITKYTTRLRKGSLFSRPLDITSATWSPDGKLFGANIQHFDSVIYSMNNADPICILKQKEYSSLATIKSGAFSETLGQPTYFAGSDNGMAYGWKIPSIVELDQNQIHTMEIPLKNQVVFQNADYFIMPMELPRADYALGAVKSVVNTVAAHPTLPMVATAGVEKTITLFSMTDTPDTIDECSCPNTLPDSTTLNFFDRLVLCT
jgi:DDB1- and CUL4-associated factor 5